MKRLLPGKEGHEEAEHSIRALIEWGETLTPLQITGVNNWLGGQLRALYLRKLAPLHEQFFGGDEALLLTHIFEPIALVEDIRVVIPLRRVCRRWLRLINTVSHLNIMSRRICHHGEKIEPVLSIFTSLTSLRASDRLMWWLDKGDAYQTRLTSLANLQSLELRSSGHK